MIARITKLLSERMALDVPTEGTDLIASGFLDSMSFVTLLEHLERELGLRISIDDLDVEQFRTIARIAEFVSRRQSAAAVPSSERRASRASVP